jgi:hypothetical protein
MSENWKPVNGFNNYLISDLGRVRSLKNNIYLKPRYCVGYNRVILYNKGKTKSFNIHRLVAIHFLPNWNKKRCVDHKNRKRNDDRVYNLRWATHAENRLNTKYPKGCVSKDHTTYYCQYYIKRQEWKRKFFKTREEAEEFRKAMYLKYSTD